MKIRGIKYKFRNKSLLIITAICAFACAIVLAILSYYTFLNNQLYADRSSMLMEIDSKLALIIESKVRATWNDMYTAEHDLSSSDISSEKKLFSTLKEIKKIHVFSQGEFIALDNLGNYYTSGGRKGRWNDMNMISSDVSTRQTCIKELPYDKDGEYMLYLKKLDKSIPVNSFAKSQSNKTNDERVDDKSNKCKVTFLAVAVDMEVMQKRLNLTGFNQNCFTYIVNEEGRRLYTNTAKENFMDGYNLITSLNKYEFTKNKSADMLNVCKNDKENMALEFKYKNEKGETEKWFVSAALIPAVDWNVMIFIPSSVLGAKTTYLMNHTIRFFIEIAVIIGVLLVFLVFITTRRYHEEKLRVQQEEANHLLEIAMNKANSANQAKSSFLSHMSHDIRTPINGIMGMTMIALKNITNQNRVQDCLKKIECSSHHLLSLINDVLDMSRIETGKVGVSHEPFDMKIMLEECCSIIFGQLLNRDVELIKEYGEFEHNKLIGDELHLRQVFINILGNSVKFTENGDKIIIRAKEIQSNGEKALYHFELEDTGIGMSKEYLPQLFEEFSQEEDGSRTSYKGTGLGMAITKKFIDMLGGTINVESELNVGTKFIIELWVDINKEVEVYAQEDNNEVSIDGMNILLVEDNELNAEIARELLEDEGAIITLAENGKEAVKVFEESPINSFDAIFMDIMMPEMDGISATHVIRDMERDDAELVPIIAMTANAYEEDIKKTKEAGMNSHLSKPLDVEAMFKILKEIYKQRLMKSKNLIEYVEEGV